MRHIVIKMRELASSNLNHLLDRAEDPGKMLGLLRGELQESIIAVQGELTRVERQADRREAEAGRLSESAEGWSEKARTALSHEREDLARSALLAREREKADAAAAQAAAKELREEAKELAATLSALEAKLEETPKREPAQAAPAAAETAPRKDGRAPGILKRIGALEKRLGFAEDAAEARQPSDDEIDGEIARIERDARIDKELEALKSSPAKGTGTRAKGRKQRSKG